MTREKVLASRAQVVADRLLAALGPACHRVMVAGSLRPSDAPTCPRCGVYHADGPRACVSVDPYVAARALVEQREEAMARVMAGAREERDRAERERDVAHERIDAALDVLGDAGCSCECGHHHEEHDEDCERCLGCRIERALRGDAA